MAIRAFNKLTTRKVETARDGFPATEVIYFSESLTGADAETGSTALSEAEK
jgi:hypothetical protein